MTLKNWLTSLNDQQKQAVTAPLEHCLVLAGAGSGKTRVLVSRMAWLIEHHHFLPESILAVTFTNKAATEMKERLKSLLSVSVRYLWVGTFHGLCHRLLRQHYREARLSEHFQIMDSDDQARLLKRVILSLNLNIEQWPVRQAQSFVNSRKDEGLRSHHIAAQAYGPQKTWLAVYRAYEQACMAEGSIDFAEILLRCFEMLKENPALLEHYRNQCQAILVDEFQDTNAIQYAWICLLAGESASVMAVGDDDQSIYGWRGAKVENIQRFTQDFHDVQVIRLEQNYRSTGTILSAANALIEHNQDRLGKSLLTEGAVGEKITVYGASHELDEARFVQERITMALEMGLGRHEIAILYRSNAQSRVLEEALIHANILYRIHGGVRFFERSEIKDALAYLRLIANTQDDTAFERVINFPTRGLGEKTLDEIRRIAGERGESLWQAALGLNDAKVLPARASQALSQFISLILEAQENKEKQTLDEQIASMLEWSGLQAHFSKSSVERSESKLENLQELVNAARQFNDEFDEEDYAYMTPLVAFLSHASLEGGEMQADEHEQYVHLMTLHAAKGLEFPLVFIVGMEEGVFPSKQSFDEAGRLEEERRLCYVGMTRAKEQLVITYANIRRQYGREEYHRPSRFLREVPLQWIQEVRGKIHHKTSQTQQPLRSQWSKTHASGINLGQNVSHPHFGLGVVLGIEGEGAHTRVQVRFTDHGTKWLVLAYANLEMDLP